MCNVKTLTRACGNANLPGTQAKLYLIPKEEILAWPTVGAGSEYGAAKTLTTAWSLVTTSGKGYWRELDILVDSGVIRIALEGNVGSKFYRNMVDFFIQGLQKEQLQLADDLAACSGCLIGMIALKGGTTIVLGDLSNPLFLEAAEGGATNEEVGLKYTLMCNTGLTPMIYNSGLAIDTTPGA